MWLPANSNNDLNRAAKHARGGIIVDGKHIGDTLQCVHCSAHWVHQEGSGAHRGWCTRCKGPICGQEPCDDCIPLEMRLEGYETGKSKVEVLRNIDSLPFTIV